MGKGKEIRKRIIAAVCAVTMTAVSIPLAFTLNAEATDNKIGQDVLEKNDGNLNRIPWNNDDIKVDISAGFNPITVVLDVNNDGNMDIMSAPRGVDSLGTMVYYGTEKSQEPGEDYMVLGEGLQVRKKENWVKDPVTIYERVGDKLNYVATKMTIGQTYYQNLADLVNNSWDHTKTDTVKQISANVYNPDKIDGETVTSAKTQSQQDKDLASYFWHYDVDGDGTVDLVWTVDEFHGEYGGIKQDKFDDNGIWGDDNGDGIGDDDRDGDDDPYHNWILWAKNTVEGTNLKASE